MIPMPDIRHSITISAPAEAVYQLVSQANGLDRWWASDVMPANAGEAVELSFFNRSTVYRLKPLAMERPHRAEWLCETGNEWAGTRLRLYIAEKDGRSVVRFTHADWAQDTPYFVDCTTVWGHLMFRLKAAAEGKADGPLFTTAGMAD